MLNSKLQKIKRDLLNLRVPGLDFNCREVKVSPTVFERDGMLLVSAEDGGYYADYYGEFRGGYPWIHPKAEEIAKKYGCYWEWENPGAISLAE